MKQKSLFVVILLSFFAINLKSQSFKNVIMDGSTNEIFMDFIEVNNHYLISGLKWKNMDTNYFRSFLLKVSLDGLDTNITFLDTFGTNNYLTSTCFYGNYLYNINCHFITKDSLQLLIQKRDTNFNLISQKAYPNVSYVYLHINSKSIIMDSMLFIVGSYLDTINRLYYPLFYKINLNTLEIACEMPPNLRYPPSDFYIDSIKKKYYIIGGKIDQTDNLDNYIMTYDSLFNFKDSLRLGSSLLGHSNILLYRNSQYLLSGTGIEAIPITSYFDQLRVQLVDSSFNTITYKSFKYNINTYIYPGYTQNLIQNKNKEYYLSGYIVETFIPSTEFGILLVKLDSNLNLIWQKRIPGNKSMKCSRSFPTNDGGLLLNVVMNDSMDGNSNAYLIKIGPNGELTSMLNLGPVPKVKIQLFPNPAKDFIEIKIENSFDKILFVEVYNIEGKLIEKHEMMNSSKLNIEHLISGVYFVNCTLQSGQKCSVKFVKD